MNSQLASGVVTLLRIVLAFFAIVFLVSIISRIHSFKRELDYLNMEIARTEGVERQYWKREKRRLWLSLLPFYRREAQ